MGFRRAVVGFTALLTVFLFVLGCSWAQDRIRVSESSGPIVLDGLMKEPAWQQAQVITDFRQRNPLEGEPATEKTEIRAVYFGKILYISVICSDSNPNLIVAKEMRRDGDIEADDNVTIVLDTYLDHRNAFYFAFNPNGARKDALVVDEGSNLNLDWNGVWDVKAVITESGWQAEVMIPFDTLRFKRADQQLWGINFCRVIRRKNEESLWQAHRRNAGLMRISEAGLLEGIPRISPAYRYEIRPYFSFAMTDSLPPDPSNPSLVRDYQPRVGVDGRIKLAENLTADLTVNTDFAQTEVDQAVLNLTRFPVMFPEKREFFLENAGFFDFLSSERTRVFFSRRIGLSSKGEPLPINVGGRVTGKIGRFDVGFLNVQTRALGLTPAADFTTLRPKLGIFKKSYVGAIFTNVYNTRDGNRNQAYGLDSVFSFSDFFGQNLSISSSIAQTSTPGTKGERTSGYFGVNYPNDKLEAFFNYSFIQKNFNPELGFLGRTAVEQYSAKWRFQPRPPEPWNKWIRQVYIKPLELNVYRTLPSHNLESLSQEFRPIGMDFQSGDDFEFNIVRHFDRLDEDFNIFGDVIIPAGKYWWNSYELQFSTASKRRWAIDSGVSWGRYYNAGMKEVGLEASFKFTSHFSLSGSYATNRMEFAHAGFRTHEISSRLVYALSNRANLQVFAQWNNDSRVADVYIRLHIIPKIGSDIYGVLNQLFDAGGNRRSVIGRAARTKVIYPFYR